jgi:nanoRNase/pAp phosphatase (c-di-AMP/oligoRNAs hydrolase)
MSNTANGFKISFRRNRGLSKIENDNIQLHELANGLNGGGHAGASGGFSASYKDAISKISKWATDHKLSLSSNKLN